MIIHEIILFLSIVNLSCFPFQTQHPGVWELIIVYALLCIQAKTLEYKLSLKKRILFSQFSVLVVCIISKTKLRGSLKKKKGRMQHTYNEVVAPKADSYFWGTTQNIEVAFLML